MFYPQPITAKVLQQLYRHGRRDFNQSDLRSIDLSESCLSGIDLAQAQLNDSNLSQVNLQGASLVEAVFSKAMLWRTDLRYSQLSASRGDRATLIRANLSHATCDRSDLGRADLRLAELQFTDFSQANLAGANLSYANLTGANLAGANLSYANLTGANLAGANLSRTQLERAIVINVNWERTELHEGDLTPVDFRSIDRHIAEQFRSTGGGIMNDSHSLLQDLLQSFPQMRAQIYFKATLTALSHAIEDLVLAGTEQPLVIANFQHERFYRQETGRYHRIAQRTDQVYVLAAPETDFASAPAPYATIGIEPTDELAQEWHLAIVGQNYSACLICREYAAPVGAIELDSARQFRGFWTFDPDVSRQAALLLLQRIGRYRPDLANQIEQAKQLYQLTSTPENVRFKPASLASNAQLLIERLVTYLQAGQYKQVKAYRRIVLEERRERLVNQIASAVRQSLKLEDILAVTIREVSQLFGQCRCVMYRLQQESATLFPVLGSIESEFAATSESSLMGENWQLATHPQFQPILNRGNIVAISDISQDTGIQAYPDLQQRLAQAQIQACLLVPICISIAAESEPRQQCLAVLELHRDRPHLWSAEDRDLLAAISTQVGIALIQAEAFVHLQQLNQQLVAVKQTQNNLIAIVGHELRTPLSTIQVCLESLDSEPDMPPEFQQSMVETALADSERLRRLIQDFLLLSRLESNLTTWQLEPIDLADSISLAVSHLQASQPHNLPTISVDLPSTLPLAIADNEALFQLLSKILDNACKFTPPTGTITVTIEEVELASQPQIPPQPMLAVQIADTGRGIEPDRLETIFERFHQEEGFLQRTVGGAGLGLAICRQLARQLGGRIWATSLGKGQGSHFYVTVPVLVD
jgi:DICT domain-containing protein/signal transduction histidine kinase/uncharacterized protein YjbI with pentapeptide repeats